MVFTLYIACVSEYFEDKEKDKETSDSESDDEEVIYKGYKTVLDSKSADEALVCHLISNPTKLVIDIAIFVSINYILTNLYRQCMQVGS